MIKAELSGVSNNCVASRDVIDGASTGLVERSFVATRTIAFVALFVEVAQ